MKKFIALVLVLLCWTSFAHAECQITGTGDLPETARKELELQCEKAKEALKKKAVESTPAVVESVASVGAAVKEAVSPEHLSTYGEVAKQFAEAIGIAATKLGMSINDFLKTPAGMIVLAVIVWKVFGHFLMMLLGIGVVIYAGRKVVLAIAFKSREVELVEGKLRTYKKITKRYYTWKEMEETQALCACIVTIVSGIACLTLFVTMFK